MIEYRTGDLLAQTDLDILTAVDNCFCTMGSGIARSIREKWPQVYVENKKTQSGDRNKLGSLLVSPIVLDNGRRAIYAGVFGQFSFGSEGRYVDYEAVYQGFEAIRDMARERSANGEYTVIGLPYKMGCDRAGGDFRIIETMLRVLFENESNVKIVICSLLP